MESRTLYVTPRNTHISQSSIQELFLLAAGSQSWSNSFFRNGVDCLRSDIGEKLAFVKKLTLAMTTWTSSRDLLASMKRELAVALPSPKTGGVHVKGREKETCPFILDCSSCEGFMVQPVCLPCGHSLCKSCMQRMCAASSRLSSFFRCPSCKQAWPQTPPSSSEYRKQTTILYSVIQKWFPRWLEACKHREEGNCFAQEGDFPLAVYWYDKALETGVSDHRILGNRSRAFLAMEELDKALRDAEACCRLRPHWAKGHFRRGAALEALGRWRESVIAYLLCLHLGGTNHTVVKSVYKILYKHLLEIAPSSSADNEGGGASGGVLARVVGTVVGTCVKEMEEWEKGGAEERRAEPEVTPEQADFECVLCTGLLYKPVTVACGHSFCQSCLSRSFDHNPFCPICRSPLAESFTQYCQNAGKMNVDITLEGLLVHYFKEACEEKRAQVEADTLRRSKIGLIESEELPMFVCTLAYPGIPCPLHVFEPRYRLMIRRCLETESRRFGMCQPGEESSIFAGVGTVLYINSVEYTPDGRCLISTIGERRFRTLNHRLRDGYHTASIEFLMDDPLSGKEEIASLRALQQEVYDHAKKWLNAFPFSQLLFMQAACSPLPGLEPIPECCPNGPVWVWWYVHVLPTTVQRKLEFLECTSLRQRLLMLKESLPLPQASSQC